MINDASNLILFILSARTVVADFWCFANTLRFCFTAVKYFKSLETCLTDRLTVCH